MEVVGHRQGVEAHRLREDRVLEEDLRLKLLVTAEIGELGHQGLLKRRA